MVSSGVAAITKTAPWTRAGLVMFLQRVFCTELEGLLHKAEEHRRKCEFVKAECQKRVSFLEKESQLKSDRILQLQSWASAQAIIHVTGLATSGIAPEAASVPPHIAVFASI